MLFLKQNRRQLYTYSVFTMLFIVYHKEQSILQMHVCAMELTAWQEDNCHHKRSAMVCHACSKHRKLYLLLSMTLDTIIPTKMTWPRLQVGSTEFSHRKMINELHNTIYPCMLVHVWRSKDNVQESVLTFYVGSGKRS